MINETDNTNKTTGLSFKLMTMNLRFGLADDGENSWEHRQHAYPGLLGKTGPDFLCVQESNNFQTQYIYSLLESHHFIGMREPSPDYWQNNIIYYSREWTCIKNKHFFISETPDIESKLEGSKWPRQCTIGLFERKDNLVILINTHFDFTEPVQRRSAELVTTYLATFPENVPVVLAGDFNSPPGGSAHNLFVESGFNDIFKGEHASTYHGFTGKDLGDHIDWILYKGNLQFGSKTIVRDSFAGLYPSDHFPVSAVFRFI